MRTPAPFVSGQEAAPRFGARRDETEHVVPTAGEAAEARTLTTLSLRKDHVRPENSGLALLV